MNNNTNTHKNLIEAFLGESKTFTKYMIYADKAEKEGYHQIARLFEHIAYNEKEHAEIWMEYLNSVGSTLQNLIDCANGEQYETQKMYPHFAEIAECDGFSNIAKKFKQVGEIEHSHLKTFNRYIELIENGELYKKQNKISWLCLNCGNIHYGYEAPYKCPVCEYDRGYYIEANNCDILL